MKTKKDSCKRYPCEITREQFELIRPLLESARKRTKPRKVDLYDVFNGALYSLKTGCQWRMLPPDYPKWRTVHEYFTIWRKENPETKKSILSECLKKIGAKPSKRPGAIQYNYLFDH